MAYSNSDRVFRAQHPDRLTKRIYGLFKFCIGMDRRDRPTRPVGDVNAVDQHRQTQLVCQAGRVFLEFLPIDNSWIECFRIDFATVRIGKDMKA